MERWGVKNGWMAPIFHQLGMNNTLIHGTQIIIRGARRKKRKYCSSGAAIVFLAAEANNSCHLRHLRISNYQQPCQH